MFEAHATRSSTPLACTPLPTPLPMYIAPNSSTLTSYDYTIATLRYASP